MSTDFRITVFGKTGCQKCKVLNKRIDDILKKEQLDNFEKSYMDVETAEGIVHFAQSECINPNRIPAFLVSKKNEATGSYERISNPAPGEEHPVCKKSRLYTWLGLQTDYSEEGKGLITPKMIKSVIQDAKGA